MSARDIVIEIVGDERDGFRLRVTGIDEEADTSEVLAHTHESALEHAEALRSDLAKIVRELGARAVVVRPAGRA